MVRLHHVFLAPLVAFSVPPQALLDLNIPVALLLGGLGIAGMLLGRRVLAVTASLSILSLLIWGKVAGNALNLSAPDTAVLLAEFTAVLLLTEASLVVLTFTQDYAILQDRRDELSHVLSLRLEEWLRNQLLNQSGLALVALSISIALIPVAGLTSASSNQLIFTATLALMAVVILMFLVIHRREPENV